MRNTFAILPDIFKSSEETEEIMLPPHCVSFKTECVRIEYPHEPKRREWIIEIPSEKLKGIQLKAWMTVSVWIVSCSRESPPFQPLWFRGMVEQLSHTYRVHIPNAIVSQGNFSHSKEVRVFISPERLEENAAILHHYLIQDGGIFIEYEESGGYWDFGGGGTLLVFYGISHGTALSTFNGLHIEEIPYEIMAQISEKFRAIDFEAVKKTPSQAVTCVGQFKLSVRKRSTGEGWVTISGLNYGNKKYPVEFQDFLRWVCILARDGIDSLQKHLIKEKEAPKPKLSFSEECPECASCNIYRDAEKRETICRDCGLIIED